MRITLDGDDDIDDDDAVLAHDDGTYVRVDDDGDGEIDDDDPMETREGDDVGGDFEIVRGGRGDDYDRRQLQRRGDLRRRGPRLHRSPGRVATWSTAATATIGCCAGWNAHERMFCGAGNDLYRADVGDDLVVGCEIYWNSEGAS